MSILTCWKWFNSVLKEANVQVTEKNQEKIEKIIQTYIGKQSNYGHCSPEWKVAHKQIEVNPKMKEELITKLKTLS